MNTEDKFAPYYNQHTCHGTALSPNHSSAASWCLLVARNNVITKIGNKNCNEMTHSLYDIDLLDRSLVVYLITLLTRWKDDSSEGSVLEENYLQLC